MFYSLPIRDDHCAKSHTGENSIYGSLKDHCVLNKFYIENDSDDFDQILCFIDFGLQKLNGLGPMFKKIRLVCYFLLQCVKINVIVSENLTEKGTNHFIHKIEIF